MANFKVHMLAFQPEYCIREVVVPDERVGDTEQTLSAIWELGQNDFQNVPGICSVSAGDVIELDNEYHLILGLGFVVITEEQLTAYKAVPREQRGLLTQVLQKLCN